MVLTPFWLSIYLDFPIQLKDLDTENSSRTYLQGLFDSFPTSEPGLYGDFAVDDGSDGEFQIYEEESEGLYSVDDHNYDEEEEDDDDDDDWGVNIHQYTPQVMFLVLIHNSNWQWKTQSSGSVLSILVC